MSEGGQGGEELAHEVGESQQEEHTLARPRAITLYVLYETTKKYYIHDRCVVLLYERYITYYYILQALHIPLVVAAISLHVDRAPYGQWRHLAADTLHFFFFLLRIYV